MKILKKFKVSIDQNRMDQVGDVEEALKKFDSRKNKNLHFLLKKRFEWMNKFINPNDVGIEVGAGPGLSKKFIINKNFKISDFADYQHLDYKNIDALNTKFNDNSFDYVIAAHVLHHVPYPIKFFREMYRILKKDGKLIIHEEYLSVLLQFLIIIMKHEGFDWTKNVWSESVPVTDDEDLWSGNNAIPHLVFDDINVFNENLGHYFKIEYEKILHQISFLNSGGVTSRTFYIPLNIFFLNFFDKIYSFFSRPFPKIFALNRCIVLKKK